MKKIIILAGAIAIISGCTQKIDYAPLQSNGLNYKFIDYIGPDSCMLYECAYHEAGENNAGKVFLTVCKDKPTTTNWDVRTGKTSTTQLTNSLVFDTVIRMVPDTTLIKRDK